MASNIGKYSVSPAELRMFMDHVDSNKLTSDLDQEITQIADEALVNQEFATFTETQFNEFKKIEKEVLGDFVLTETFRQQMGIEPKGTTTPAKERHFDQVSMTNLLGVWMEKSPEDVAKQFLKMEPFEQKVFLEALSHFCKTTDFLRASKGGLTSHEIIILHSMSEKVALSNVPFPTEKGPISPETYRLFKQLYPLYKGVRPTDDEMTQSFEANTYLSTSREAARLEQTYAPDLSTVKSAPPSIAKKRTMKSGEKRIGGEVKNDVRQLSKANADLKVRIGKRGFEGFDKKDTSLKSDVARYAASCSVTVAKAEALVALYSPYVMQDPDIALLGAKAMADLAHVLALEGDARAFLEETRQQPLLGQAKADELREQSRNLFKEAEILAEWAHLKGQPKAGILLSKLIRINADSLTKDEKTKVYGKAQDALNEACFKKDQEALIENARLHTAMWLNGDTNVKEEDALIILVPLGKKGADALREHFEAGSAEAGARLADIILTKSNSKTFKEKFESFYQSVVDLFSSGNVVLAGEEPFLSKDPHRLSSAETDFLIKEALINSRSTGIVSAAIKQEGLGPKVPLNQARQFLIPLVARGEKMDDQNPYMVVNRREAYSYLESAAKALLSSTVTSNDKQVFATNILRPYLEKLETDSYAYFVLDALLIRLGSPQNLDEYSGAVTSKDGLSRSGSFYSASDSSEDEFFDVEKGEDFMLPPSPGISRRSSVVSELDDDGGEYDYDTVEIEELKGSFSSSIRKTEESDTKTIKDTSPGTENWYSALEGMLTSFKTEIWSWRNKPSTTTTFIESSPEPSTSAKSFPPLEGEGGGGIKEESAVIKPTGQSQSGKQVQVVMNVGGYKVKVQGTRDEIVQLSRIAKLLSTPTPPTFFLALYLAAPWIKKQYPDLSPREMAQLMRSLFISRGDIRLPPAKITEITEGGEGSVTSMLPPNDTTGPKIPEGEIPEPPVAEVSQLEKPSVKTSERRGADFGDTLFATAVFDEKTGGPKFSGTSQPKKSPEESGSTFGGLLNVVDTLSALICEAIFGEGSGEAAAKVFKGSIEVIQQSKGENHKKA